MTVFDWAASQLERAAAKQTSWVYGWLKKIGLYARIDE